MSQGSNNAQSQPGLASQERAAREYLAQGRFRKARDEFKALCKLDRPKYLPLLVEANLGLAREMLSKGMSSEARQVVDYLKTIATREQLLALELELGADQGGAGWRSAEVLQVLCKPGLEGKERGRLVDRLVLTFAPVANPPAAAVALAGELGAVLAGLRAISEGQFGRALEEVRPLGRASIFSDWKMFIKGLAAFYSGDKAKAARYFKELPSESVPGQAGQAFLLLLGAVPLVRESPLPSAAVVEWACRIAGEANCGGPLLRAEQAWRKEDPAQMYMELQKGIPRFPSERADFLGVLSQFAVNCGFTLPYELREQWLDMADEIVDGEASKSQVEMKIFLRAILLALAPTLEDEEAIEYCERFLRAREKLSGVDTGLDAEAYGWLGDLMSKPGEPYPRSGQERDSEFRMRNPAEAQRLLEMALSLDPQNLAAGLRLCEVYKRQRKNSERNLLLDQLSARFQTDKKVLLMTAGACIERRSYKKGLDYLHQAYAIDRLDPAIPDLMVKARLAQARDYFQKKSVEQARGALEQIAGFEVEAAGNFQRSRWCLNIRRGLLESVWGEKAKSAAYLEEARRGSPSAAAFLFYAALAGLEIGARDGIGSQYLEELARRAKREANAADAVMLTRIWLLQRDQIPEGIAEEPAEVLEKYLRQAAKRPAAREDVCRLAEFALVEDRFAPQVVALLHSQLKHDRRDPALRFYRFRLKELYLDSIEDNTLELRSILDEAIRRKDDQTIRQARQQLDERRELPPIPMPPFGPGDPFAEPDDEDDGEFDAEEWDDPENLGSVIEAAAGHLPPGEAQLMHKMLEMLANASDDEIEVLERTRPPRLPVESFRMLVRISKLKKLLPGMKGAPAKVAARKPLPPKTPPPPDPNQPELF